MAIKGAIFDMDGTLLDSMHVWVGIAQNYLASKQIELTPEIQKDISGMMLKEMSEYFITRFGFEVTSDDVIKEINGIVENEYFHNVQPKPGVLEFLESLKSQGVKMCVATATDRYMAEAALKRCGLFDYFEFMITCTEANANKTVSTIYDMSLERLGTEKSDTYIFEDTYIPVKTAKDSGYHIVAVADKWSMKNADRLKEVADLYVENLSQIMADTL